MTVANVAGGGGSGGGGGGGGGGGIVPAGKHVLAYSIYASCCVAFWRTLPARSGALTSRAFLWRQIARAIIVTPAMMPMTMKNLNTVAG